MTIAPTTDIARLTNAIEIYEASRDGHLAQAAKQGVEIFTCDPRWDRETLDAMVHNRSEAARIQQMIDGCKARLEVMRAQVVPTPSNVIEFPREGARKVRSLGKRQGSNRKPRWQHVQEKALSIMRHLGCTWREAEQWRQAAKDCWGVASMKAMPERGLRAILKDVQAVEALYRAAELALDCSGQAVIAATAQAAGCEVWELPLLHAGDCWHASHHVDYATCAAAYRAIA